MHDYATLIALSIVHGMLLGTFVPATLMIILRNLPIKWWLPAISIYSIRVGFALDSSTSSPARSASPPARVLLPQLPEGGALVNRG